MALEKASINEIYNNIKNPMDTAENDMKLFSVLVPSDARVSLIVLHWSFCPVGWIGGTSAVLVQFGQQRKPT